MIRQLVLSVATILGLTTVAMGQYPGPQQPPPAEVRLVIYPDTSCEPDSWKMNFSGTWSTIQYWTTADFQVILMPKLGGISRVCTGSSTVPGEWTAKSSEGIPPGAYTAFVISKGWDSRMDKSSAGDYCSKVIDVTSPTQIAGATINPPAADAPIGTFRFGLDGPTRTSEQRMAGAAEAAKVGNDPQTETVFRPTSATMVLLPTDGGKFLRIQSATWNNTVATIYSQPLNANPKYNVYLHVNCYQKVNTIVIPGDYTITTAIAKDR